MKKNFFLNSLFAKHKNFRMKCVWNNKFFSRKAIAKLIFVLHSTYARDTPYRVLLDLDNSLTPSKRPIFKIRYSQKSLFYVCKFNFFPRQAITKILFLLHSTTYTRVLHTKFDWIRTTPWTDEKGLYSKIYNLKLFEIIANLLMNLQLFF